MNWSKNCRLGGGLTFSLVPDFMPKKKTWRDFVPNIAYALTVILIIVALVAMFVHVLDRPVVNESYTTHEIKSVSVGGENLYPGDPGFEKAKKNATSHNWVQ